LITFESFNELVRYVKARPSISYLLGFMSTVIDKEAEVLCTIDRKRGATLIEDNIVFAENSLVKCINKCMGDEEVHPSHLVLRRLMSEASVISNVIKEENRHE